MSGGNRFAVLTGLPDAHQPYQIKTAGRKEGELLIGDVAECYWPVMFTAEFFQPDSGIDFVNEGEHNVDCFVG